MLRELEADPTLGPVFFSVLEIDPRGVLPRPGRGGRRRGADGLQLAAPDDRDAAAAVRSRPAGPRARPPPDTDPHGPGRGRAGRRWRRGGRGARLAAVAARRRRPRPRAGRLGPRRRRPSATPTGRCAPGATGAERGTARVAGRLPRRNLGPIPSTRSSTRRSAAARPAGAARSGVSSPSDFRGATLDGFGRDWPIGYEDLERYYEINEAEMGMSGIAGDPTAPPTSRRRCRPSPWVRWASAGSTVSSGSAGTGGCSTRRSRRATTAAGRPARQTGTAPTAARAGTRDPREHLLARGAAQRRAAADRRAGARDHAGHPRTRGRRALPRARRLGPARDRARRRARRQRAGHAAAAAHVLVACVPRRAGELQRDGRPQPHGPRADDRHRALPGAHGRRSWAVGCDGHHAALYETDPSAPSSAGSSSRRCAGSTRSTRRCRRRAGARGTTPPWSTTSTTRRSAGSRRRRARAAQPRRAHDERTDGSGCLAS